MLTLKAGVLKPLATALATSNVEDCCIKELKYSLEWLPQKRVYELFIFLLQIRVEGRRKLAQSYCLSFSIKTPITPSCRRPIIRAWQQLMHLYIGWCVINGPANSWWQWKSEFPQFTALCKTSSGTFLSTIITQTPLLTSLSVSEWYQRLKTHNHSSMPCVLCRAAQYREKN